MDSVSKHTSSTSFKMTRFSDLHPIITLLFKIVWAAMKHFITDGHVDFNLGKVKSLCVECFNIFSAQDWESYCPYAITSKSSIVWQLPISLICVNNELVINIDNNFNYLIGHYVTEF